MPGFTGVDMYVFGLQSRKTLSQVTVENLAPNLPSGVVMGSENRQGSKLQEKVPGKEGS